MVLPWSHSLFMIHLAKETILILWKVGENEKAPYSYKLNVEKGNGTVIQTYYSDYNITRITVLTQLFIDIISKISI